MPRLTMCYGLPGSGKSTWAKAVVSSNPGHVKRINKDEMRAMVDAGEHSKVNEREILEIRDLLVERWLRAGHDVIVDDTNLHPKHEKRLREIVSGIPRASFTVRYFTDISVEECIRRDLQRPVSVGEKVIRKMWKDYLFEPEKDAPAPPRVQGPRAIVVDVDGTVAQMVGRGPHDYERVGEDEPKTAVIKVVHDWLDLRIAGSEPWHLIFCSGRPDSCRDQTEEWLKKHVIGGLQRSEWSLFMRPTWMEDPKSGKRVRDHRNDAVVKTELYQQNIAGRFNIDYVLDDRARVVSAWRALGLLCLQVAPGDF